MKKTSSKTVLAVAAAAVAAFGASPLEIAVRGKAPAYTIVVPEKASPAEKYAAEELQGFLEKVAGVKLPVASDAAPLPPKAILLGETKYSLALLNGGRDGARPSHCGGFDHKTLGSDGFRLAARPPHIVAYGSAKRGALYAAYEILEKYAGCRWYASWHSAIPRRERVEVPGDIDDVQVPALAMRQPFWYDVNNNRDFAARLRVNGYNHTSGTVDAKFGGDDFRFGGGLGSCHTFEALLPQGVYFDKHPEYYSLVKGRRLRGRTQLCLTNPDVLRIVTSNVLARIRRDPGAKFYGVSQNDWYNFCECEKCAAVDKEEESHAGTMVRFVNAVAEAVEKEFPDVIIETLAYQYTRRPPKKTRLRHNVVPCLCTIECDFAQPIDKSPFRQNISFRDDIRGWAKQTDMLYVWDYTTDFAHYAMPFPNVYALQGNVRFFRDNGVKCLFEQGAYQGRHGDFAELKAWLLAKWMWNPELPVKPLLDDFFAGYYGKAAPFVREYFESIHKMQMAASSSPDRPLGIFDPPAKSVLSDEFIGFAAGLWRQAVDAVKDDPATSYNVRMAAFAFDYLRLARINPKPARREVLFAPDGAGDARVSEVGALARSLLDRMAEARNIRLSEGLGRHNALVAEWKALAAPLATNAVVNAVESQHAVLEERRLRLVKPGIWGAFVDDPEADDGKALRLFNTHFEWCATFSMNRVKFRPGAKYRVRARIRVERARDGGEAFWAGVYDVAAKRDAGSIAPRTESVKDPGYVWHDVCTWTPRADGNEYFWIGPGRFGADGKSSVKAVFIDKIEMSLVRQAVSPGSDPGT